MISLTNEAIRVIKERRSVREYLPKPIPKEILEDIVDCGRLAPSANNIQPWLFVVTTEKPIKEKIASLATYGKFIANAGACISVFCRKDAYHAIEDGCAATENILLAAKAYDIASCWVAGYNRPYSEAIRELLNVPEDYMLISLLSLGYSDKVVTRNKKPLKEVMRWEKY
ncbi:nitroreductase family protein [Tepidanaerobacter syntrophicus]|uniref:nitroreductase family protein n=1 Tax=Tepidanaerobacter syntrophicus TaxID=224999 RepID=UPI0024921A44|nr:nitroreductase family protein [Tepidanaerobacter syntrophicus]